MDKKNSFPAAVAVPHVLLCAHRELVSDWGGAGNRHHENQCRLSWLILNNLLYLLAWGPKFCRVWIPIYKSELEHFIVRGKLGQFFCWNSGWWSWGVLLLDHCRVPDPTDRDWCLLLTPTAVSLVCGIQFCEQNCSATLWFWIPPWNSFRFLRQSRMSQSHHDVTSGLIESALA